MPYRITAPEQGFSGEVAGLHFAQGVAVGDPSPGALAYFGRRGYGIEEAEAPAPVPSVVTGSGMFDPATHDVAGVLLYLDGAGAEEARRVLDAEESEGGKQRKGIVGARAEILAREEAHDAALAERLHGEGEG